MTPDHSALIERLDLIVAELEGLPHVKQTVKEAAAALRDLTAELEDARVSVCAFAAPWAVTFARERGYPDGALHADHYDTLAKAGARMDSFTRYLPSTPNQAKEAGE